MANPIGFTSAELGEITADLVALGLWDSTKGSIKDVAKLQITTPGAFAPLYADVSAILASRSNVDPNIAYWFSKAPAINADDTSNPADNYIRGLTQYGLELNGKLIGLSQPQIKKLSRQ
jgi:hypothetical protein